MASALPLVAARMCVCDNKPNFILPRGRPPHQTNELHNAADSLAFLTVEFTHPLYLNQFNGLELRVLTTCLATRLSGSGKRLKRDYNSTNEMFSVIFYPQPFAGNQILLRHIFVLPPRVLLGDGA